MNLIVGIDASRNRSGGAIAHLVGIISSANPSAHGIREVHVWSYKTLLDALPDAPWLVRHNPPELERSLLSQVWWQYHWLPMEAKKSKCDILFTTDAATVCRYRSMVVMSQDMLSYEPGVMGYFGFTKARLRLLAILVIQNRAMRFANGVIFLTKYASQVIQQTTGKLNRIAIIPHGIDPAFKQQSILRSWPSTGERPIHCIYISNIAMYKHQWVVLRAIAELRKRGYKIRLILAGVGSGRAQQLLDDEIAASDPQRLFVETIGFVHHDNLPSLLANSDLFVFASSCENLPVTLLEAMATGLPIACSNRGPMPEVLRDGGVYFDPEGSESIAAAIEKIIINADLRISIAKRAKELSEQYSWARCAAETWHFLKNTSGLEKL
jgi:glycosyltransferase involved in cell wall biosynthesis